MTMQLKIGIDVDGVLYDFVSAFRRLAQQTFGKDFPTFSSDWDFSNWGLTSDEYKSLWTRVRGSVDWFLDNEKPYSFAVESLTLLKNHELYFITTRCPTQGETVLRQTQRQLNMLGVEFPTVVVTNDKGAVVQGLSLNFYIDDYVENLKRVQECSPSTKLFLVNQTYNNEILIPTSWARISSLKEFAERIDNVAVAD